MNINCFYQIYRYYLSIKVVKAVYFRDISCFVMTISLLLLELPWTQSFGTNWNGYLVGWGNIHFFLSCTPWEQDCTQPSVVIFQPFFPQVWQYGLYHLAPPLPPPLTHTHTLRYNATFASLLYTVTWWPLEYQKVNLKTREKIMWILTV